MSKETGRVTVSTYVPAHQRDEWREHAERLDMSQSEFVRTMVQAGRRGFDFGDESGNGEEPDVEGSNPRGNGLETDVLDALESTGPLDWDDLVDELNGDFEARLEEVLEGLQSEGRVRHRGRKGGYVVVEGEHGE